MLSAVASLPGLAPTALWIINGLVLLVVILATALARVQFKHIQDQQKQQDRRLEILEELVGGIDKENSRSAEELRNLSGMLEHYFQELKEQIEASRKETRSNLKSYRDDDDKAHRQILETLGERLKSKKA